MKTKCSAGWVIVLLSFLAVSAMPTVVTATGKIAFKSQRNGFAGIWVMLGNGTFQRQLTNQGDFQPDLSRDGTRIVFHSFRDGGDSEIYVMNANGTGQTRLTESEGEDRDPVFSPDGSKIAFVSNRDGNHEIYLMNADGTGLTRVTNTPSTGEFYPAFNPAGTRIVFGRTALVLGPVSGIHSVNLDGSGLVLISSGPGDVTPSYSPDGSRIVFSSRRPGVPVGNIWSMDPDGSDPLQLTDNTADDNYPAYSPDGTLIVFSSNLNGHTDIFTMDTAGGGLTNLTPTSINDSEPSWSQIADTDSDGIEESYDNCASTANADQADTDADGVGNACDADDDNDGIPDVSDNCPLAANTDQLDTDGDGQGNVCDADDDNDGVADGVDNCSLVTNADQANTDGDAMGNACDPDDDNDGLSDDADPDTLSDLISSLPDANFNGQGNKNSFLTRLEAIEKKIKSGNVAAALNDLQNMRRQVDGCGTSADSNDFVIDCTSQQSIRALIDTLIGSLT